MSAPPLSFRVEGMDCAEEVGILKRELGAEYEREVVHRDDLVLLRKAVASDR